MNKIRTKASNIHKAKLYKVVRFKIICFLCFWQEFTGVTIEKLKNGIFDHLDIGKLIKD